MQQQHQLALNSLSQDLARVCKEKAIIASEAAIFKMQLQQRDEKIEHLEKELAKKESEREKG